LGFAGVFSCLLTTGTDVFVGVSNADDTFTATEANFEGDSDILVDGGSADNDTLNVTGTAFSAAITSAGNTISGIENVNVAFDSLVQSTFTASGVIGGATITVSQSRSGGSDDIIVATAGDGSTVVAGSGVNTLTVSTMTAGYDLTVDGGSATGTITADLTTDGILSVTADTATSINVSTATGNATVAAAAATTIDVETTSGDISITTDVDSNIDADSTIAGDIVIVAAASEDVVANTTGAGVVTVTAEGNAITTVAKTATINVVEADTTATDMSVTGTGTADSVTINLGDDATVTNAAANAVETITINATSAAVVTVDTTAATTYVGDANTTFAGNEAMFDGKDVTGAAEVQITTLDTSDLTGVATDTNINVAASAASKTLTVAGDANIEISAAITTGLTLKYSDGATANDDAGVLNVTLNKASITGALALDVTADTVATLNLTVATAPSAFVLTAGSTDVVATGSKALALTNTSTFGSLDASAMTGAVTVSAITSGDVITTGSAADTVTLVSTATTADVSTGAGNDAISTSAAYAGALDAGAGTDTLTVGGAVDLSGATISNVERLEIGALAVSVDEAFFNDQSIVVGGTGTITVKNVTASLDLSLLTFSSTAATSVDFTSSRDASLGAGADFSVVGSANIDTIVTGNGSNDVQAGAGNDSVTGGTGVDTILGGAGDDTIAGGTGADALYGEAGADSITGGDGADTIVGGAGEDVITGGAGADSIDLGSDGESDDVVLDTYATIDSISGFEADDDILIVDFSALEALATDAVYLDDAVSLADATVAPVFNTIDGEADLGDATADSTILVIDGTIASASALETALETGGDFALTVNQAWAIGDIFLAMYTDGTDTYLAAVETTDTVADDALIGAGDLTATVIAKLVGITDPTTLTAANFDYQA
jgi:Ca2+-binding RTX toxin-like protein